MKYGRQRWKLRGRIEINAKQVWDSEEMVFLPLVSEFLSIKVRFHSLMESFPNFSSVPNPAGHKITLKCGDCMTVHPRALTSMDKTKIKFCSTASVHWGTIYGFQASLAKVIEMDGASSVCRGLG